MIGGKKLGVFLGLLIVLSIFAASGAIGIIIECECNADCDDGQFCTIDECVDRDCVYSARDCSDEVECTEDACNECQDKCENIPNDELCYGSDECGEEICDAKLGCVYEKYDDIIGPVTTDLTATKVPEVCKIDIEAVEEDICSTVAAAEYFLGGITCGEEGTGFSMDAKDGLFDELIEDVIAVNVNVQDGSLNVHVRGKDSEGNWGECETIHIDIDCLPPDCPICEIGDENYGTKLNGECNPNELLICGEDPTLEAIICDSESYIQLAEYFVDEENPINWRGIAMEASDEVYGDEHCEDVEAIIDISQLSEGTHYVQVHGKDTQENWGKFICAPEISFIKDTIAPSTDKELIAYDDKEVGCDIQSAMGEEITDGCAYVLPGTEIVLSATDPDTPDHEIAGNVVIKYNVYWTDENNCEEAQNWILDQSGQSNVDEPVTITLDEDSCHLIEYWAEDLCENEEEHHYELDIVDNSAPETEKTINGPQIEGDGNPIHYYLGGQSSILLSCADVLPHPVDDVTLNWELYWSLDCDEPEWVLRDFGSSDGQDEIFFRESSCHKLVYYCEDALGNAEEEQIEIDAVDTQAPEIVKEIIGPNLPCEGGLITEECERWACLGDDNKDFFVTGRHDPTNWDLAIKTPTEIVQDSDEYSWVNDGEPVPFSVSYDSSTGEVIYNVDGTELSYTYDSGKAFEYLVLISKGAEGGCDMALLDVEVNGQDVGDVISSGNYQGLKVYLSDAMQEEGFIVTGSAAMIWESGCKKQEIPAFHVFAMNTHDSKPEDCYIIDGVTEIHVDAIDPEPHPVNQVECEWGYWWNDQWYGWYEADIPFVISELDESEHELHIKCWDALGNEVEDVEMFIVDKTPPVIEKTYGEPYVYGSGPEEYITSDTPIYVRAYDPEPHPSGLAVLEYRVTLLEDDSACYDSEICELTIVEEGSEWTPYEGEFNIKEESCHLIEIYAEDNVEKSATHKQCVLVDNSAPEVEKTIGEPKIECDEEDPTECDYYVSKETPITFTCEDVSPHPVGGEELCFKVSWDDEELIYLTEQYCSEDLEDGWCCVDAEEAFEFHFLEDSLHNIEYYCKDELGNEGEELIEWDNVDDTPPWIIIHNPTERERESIKRCDQSIVVEVFDEKSGVNESTIYAELYDENNSLVRNVTLHKAVYKGLEGGDIYEGLMNKELPNGTYTLYVYASDNLGNKNEETYVDEYLQEGIYLEYLDPAQCVVDMEDGGECEFGFHVCVRGDNRLKFWMDKLGEEPGLITPDMLNAMVYNDYGEGYVGLWHALEDQKITDAGEIALIDEGKVNGKTVFYLQLEIGPEETSLIGTGIYDLEYLIETWDP